MALIGAATELGSDAFRGRTATVRDSAWIWAPGIAQQVEPVAFLAVRDFRLEEMPREARLTVTADEEYIAFVNGTRVGGGSFRQDAPAQSYEVVNFLKLAGNRLTFELRSSRGAGGLAVRLDLTDAEGLESSAVVTDDEWQIYRQADPKILHGGFLSPGEPAAVWGRAPTGRWRPSAAEPRPIPGFEVPPLPRRRAARVMVPEDGTWHSLDRFKNTFPALGERVVLDWGEEVHGYLMLDLARLDGLPGYVYFGNEPPHERSPPADAFVLPVPGRKYWQDAHARSFRYAWLVGVALHRVPEILPVAENEVAQLGPPPPGRSGPFGVEPPRADALAEEQIRQRY